MLLSYKVRSFNDVMLLIEFIGLIRIRLEEPFESE